MFKSSVLRAWSEHKYHFIGSLKKQEDKREKLWKTPQVVHKQTMIEPYQ